MDTNKISFDLAKSMMVEYTIEAISNLKKFIKEESNGMPEKDINLLKKYLKKLKKAKKRVQSTKTEKEFEETDNHKYSYYNLMTMIEKIVIKNNKG